MIYTKFFAMLNSHVKTVAEFILQKSSPYKIIVTNLHNFV